MKTFKKIVGAVSVLSLLISAQGAVLAPVDSEGSDREIYGDGTGRFVGQSTARIGKDGNSTVGNSFIMAFALPTLPSGNEVVSASLAIDITGTASIFGGDPAWNIDLYGLRSSNSSATDLGVGPASNDTGDFFIGANDATDATKLQDDFWAIPAFGGGSGPATGEYTTDGAGSTALGDWLATLYSGVTPNNTYAFIRLNSDLTVGGGMNDRFVTVGTGDHGTSSLIPTLTITTAIVPAPEPSSLALIGLGAFVLVNARKKMGRKARA